MDSIIEKLLKVLTEPSEIVLLGWVGYLVRESWLRQKVIDRLLKAQEERGIVLTKITVMLEYIFNDSRRPK
jgi:hypothetical protein